MFAREFEYSAPLKWALGALTFGYFVAFNWWIESITVTRHAVDTFNHVCPKYLQACEWMYVLEVLPRSYAQATFYMLLFALLLAAVYAMYRRQWVYAQALLLLPFLWHAGNVLIFSYLRQGNFEYYLIIFGLILLFLPYKEFFLKLSLVLLYTLSTVAKIHPAWIAGTYFSSLQTGLPFVPDAYIPLATNLVILMEMIGAWFLFSGNRYIQRSVLAFFIFFHLYSGIMVDYRYPSTVLPLLVIMFGPWHRTVSVPLDRRSLPGWTLVGVLIVLQFIPVMIPGDEKLTLEANKYGLYMFESNHQCISDATIHYKNGRQEKEQETSVVARQRCDPYRLWFTFKKRCERIDRIDRIEWTFDHSINGDPFLRIVDLEDACDVEYKPFSQNEWIKTHDDGPKVIGYPVKNWYY